MEKKQGKFLLSVSNCSYLSLERDLSTGSVASNGVASCRSNSYVNELLCCNKEFLKGVITVLDLIAVVFFTVCQDSFLKVMTNRPVLILGWQPHHWWRYLWCGE